MYIPNLRADARACRLIRFLLAACLLAPLFCACATTAQRAVRHEYATPRRQAITANPSPLLTQPTNER